VTIEKYAYGAITSFCAALVVAVVTLLIIVFKNSEKGGRRAHFGRIVRIWLDDDFAVRAGLIIVFFIALWLAMRTVGLGLERFLLDEDFPYGVLQVFDILAYVLAMNVCLTLLKRSKEQLPNIVSATMQSVLVGLLVFLPRATTPESLGVYGQYGSAVILVGFSVALIALGYAQKSVRSAEKKQNG